MQWLIDIIAEKVIAEIGIPPVYIDRGDPAAPDWTQAVLTLDNTFHELDISAIVPANASVILFGIIVLDNAVGKILSLRKSGNINTFNASNLVTQVANVIIQQDYIVSASPNQKIEYSGSAGIDTIFLTVRGWWL